MVQKQLSECPSSSSPEHLGTITRQILGKTMNYVDPTVISTNTHCMECF